MENSEDYLIGSEHQSADYTQLVQMQATQQNGSHTEADCDNKQSRVAVKSVGIMKDFSNNVLCRAVDVFEVVLVASSCVVIWFAIWTLMDLVIPFQEQFIWLILISGFCGSFFCIYLEKIPCILECIHHSTTKRLVFKFVHDFLITWFQVCLWYGWWNLLDLYTSGTFPRCAELFVSMAILVSCRALTVSAQYSICKENIWSDPIESDTLSTGVNQTANITVTLSLVHILSITVWTQVWNLTDTFVLPDHYYLSTSYSLAFGVLSLSFLFFFDQIKRYIFCRCSKTDENLVSTSNSNHTFLQIVYYVMATVGLVASIQTWRGSWGIAEYYLDYLHETYGHEKSTEAWLMLLVMLLMYAFIFTYGYSQNVGSYAADFDISDFSLDKYFLIWSDSIGAEIRQSTETTQTEENNSDQEVVSSKNQIEFKNLAKITLGASNSKSANVQQNPNRLPEADEDSQQKPLLLEEGASDEEDEIMSL